MLFLIDPGTNEVGQFLTEREEGNYTPGMCQVYLAKIRLKLKFLKVESDLDLYFRIEACYRNGFLKVKCT